jgi:ribonuclease VapC
VIVDASAILAILFDEPERGAFQRAIADAAGDHVMSPVNYLEASIKADDPRHPRKGVELDLLLSALSVTLAPVTLEQARLARSAYKRFGKRNHSARLNLGDCFAYALAKARGEPLLFKGSDFAQTDIESAIGTP